MKYVEKQVYPVYTEEDHGTWSILFERNAPVRDARASTEYIKGLGKLNICQDCIPSLEELNNSLFALTGWEAFLVPGLVAEKDFFEMLLFKKFPIVNSIRRRESLEYVEEPDLFHDLYAHLPLLANQGFCDFLSGLSNIAIKYNFDESVIRYLARVYWFSTETGLIMENGELKIYGAAVISSVKEADNVYSDKSEKLPFEVKKVMNTDFDYDLQKRYFFIKSFDELFKTIRDINKEIEKKIN